jgi:hypothetical protein
VCGSGQPKGLKQVLLERGYPWVNGKGGTTKPIAQKWLGEQPDFLAAQSILEMKFATVWAPHMCIKIPKYHPAFNPIERLWAFSKRYCRDHCNYSIVSLRTTIHTSLSRATPEMCGKFFAKIDWIEAQYRQGTSVYDLETGKQKKSHRTGREGDRCVASYGVQPKWGAAS